MNDDDNFFPQRSVLCLCNRCLTFRLYNLVARPFDVLWNVISEIYELRVCCVVRGFRAKGMFGEHQIEMIQ